VIAPIPGAVPPLTSAPAATRSLGLRPPRPRSVPDLPCHRPSEPLVPPGTFSPRSRTTSSLRAAALVLSGSEVTAALAHSPSGCSVASISRARSPFFSGLPATSARCNVWPSRSVGDLLNSRDDNRPRCATATRLEAWDSLGGFSRGSYTVGRACVGHRGALAPLPSPLAGRSPGPDTRCSRVCCLARAAEISGEPCAGRELWRRRGALAPPLESAG
jgi:hypothetical protein